MTVLAITIALIALLGSIFIWLRLKKVKATLAHLEQMHSSSTAGRVVEFIAFPPVAAPPTELAPEDPPSGNRIILGFRNETIILENQSNGENLITKDISVEIPRGTTDVLPLISGFTVLFGEITKIKDPVVGAFSYGLEDHNFGFGEVNIRVVEIGGVTEFGTVTATLQAQMLLRDADGDDEWAGWMHVHILFLGVHP